MYLTSRGFSHSIRVLLWETIVARIDYAVRIVLLTIDRKQVLV